jgi:hypothetical protein
MSKADLSFSWVYLRVYRRKYDNTFLAILQTQMDPAKGIILTLVFDDKNASRVEVRFSRSPFVLKRLSRKQYETGRKV